MTLVRSFALTGLAAVALLFAAETAAAQSADTLYRSIRGAETQLAPAPGPTAPAADPGFAPRTIASEGSGLTTRTPRVRTRGEIERTFTLGGGDVISVSVLEDSSLDRQLLVRPDGHVSMPLAGSIHAAGRTPEQVAAAIRRGLSDDFIEPPTVTVALVALGAETEEDAILTVYVVGEVNRPGGFQVRQPVGLLQALALAGGPGVFAAKDRMQVRRVTGQGVEEVLVVDYEALERGAAAPMVLLGDGDTVMVPERGLFD